jgi:quercetin dioxygenase-like cupin family protein
VHGLEGELLARGAPAGQMRRLASRLEQHIRFEERVLFALIERVVPADALSRLGEVAGNTAAVELLSPEGKGPLWGSETEDLNATLLAWPPDTGPPEHVNAERNVLLVVLAGSATVTVNGEATLVEAGQATTIEKGRVRRIAAGPEGVRYVSVHVRRPPLQIFPATGPARRRSAAPDAS